MRILVTGFEPFDGRDVNTSWEAVRRLPRMIGNNQVVTKRIPVAFGSAMKAVAAAIDAQRPDAVISVGEAATNNKVEIEYVAINVADATIADNEGHKPVDERLEADGPDGYFSTLPVKRIVSCLSDKGLPIGVSYSAGTFVCNSVMYSALHHGGTQQAGFVHVPLADEFNSKQTQHVLTLSEIVNVLIEVIKQL